MIIRATPEPTLSAFRRLVEEVAAAPGIAGVLGLGCDENGWEPDAVDQLVRSTGVRLFGGCFPALIHDDQVLEQGSLAIGLKQFPALYVVDDLSRPERDFDTTIQSLYGEGPTGGTMLVLVDGMATGVGALLNSLFNEFGLDVSYIGGGAGSLTLRRKPCLFTNEGFREDAALLALLPGAAGIGVRHGMTPISGPHRVTNARGSVVRCLDFKPAMQVYREAIEKHPEHASTRDEQYWIDPSFSLGLNRLGAERVVREPIRRNLPDEPDGALAFGPEMATGQFVDFMHATPESTIASAAEALAVALASYVGHRPPAFVLSFDCTARQLYLGERHGEEVRAMKAEGLPLVGALTIGGEIANNARNYLEYYNRTCVIGAMEEP